MGNQNSKPDNNIIWFWVLCSAVAIIHTAKVDGLYRSGDYSGAQEAAYNAKKYAQYGLIVGLIVGVIYFFIGMAGSM